MNTFATSPMSQNGLLTTDEAAAYLKISKSTLERYRVSGTPAIPYIKIGGKRGPVLYRVKDLIDFLDRSTRTSTSQSGPEGKE